MMDYLQALKEFHLAFGHYVQDRPNPDVPISVAALRTRLIEEEKDELFQAMVDHNIVEIADALADLLYVVFGTAVSYGIPIDEVFAIVHKSNMSKLGPNGKPLKDAGGKTIKPPDWTPPTKEILACLEQQK